MVNWAHVLTAARLVLIVPITFALLQGSLSLAVTLYILAALTDFFDGRIARKQGTASEFGAKFDAAVDMIFSVMIFVWLWALVPVHRAFLSVVFFVLLVSYIITGIFSFAKSGRLVSMHLQVGRAGTFLLFVAFPVIVLFGYPVPVLSVAAFVVLAGRAEAIWEMIRKKDTSSIS